MPALSPAGLRPIKYFPSTEASSMLAQSCTKTSALEPSPLTFHVDAGCSGVLAEKYAAFPSIDQAAKPDKPSIFPTSCRSRPSAPVTNALVPWLVRSSKLTRDPSRIQAPVSKYPDVASLILLLPSRSDTQTSFWLGPKSLRYITRLPSGEIEG